MITNKNILELEKRSQIYQFVKNTPGLHLRELERKTQIPKSTLLHHLKFLEKRELIKSSQYKRYTRYYAKGKIGKEEKKIIDVIRQEIPFKIVINLLIASCITSRKELSIELEKHPNTISFHLKKLIKAGIVEKCPIVDGMGIRPKSGKFVRIGRLNKNQKIYRLVDPNIIYDLIIINKDNMFYKGKYDNKILKWGLEYHISELKLPDVANDFDTGFDFFLKELYEVFPHPYHI